MPKKAIKIKTSLTNSHYVILPDAPTFTSVKNFEAESPYHLSAPSFFKSPAQILTMAIACVIDFSKIDPGRLDFSVKSLSILDKDIEKFASKNPDKIKSDDIELYVCEVGSYLGVLMESELKHTYKYQTKWHLSYPNYQFSALRILYTKDVQNKKVEGYFETNPFVAVTKRIVSLLFKEAAEVTLEQYAMYVLSAADHLLIKKK